jgi:hypothetical protein
MALVQLASSEEAVAALVKLHNYQLSETSHLRYHFITTLAQKMALVQLHGKWPLSLNFTLSALRDIPSQVAVLSFLLKRWLWCSWLVARRQWPLSLNFTTISSQRHLISGNIILPHLLKRWLWCSCMGSRPLSLNFTTISETFHLR